MTTRDTYRLHKSIATFCDCCKRNSTRYLTTKLRYRMINCTNRFTYKKLSRIMLATRARYGCAWKFGSLLIAKVSDRSVQDWFHIRYILSYNNNWYICNEGEKRLSIIMLLGIMPYFPYSANRIKLIYLARPSIIYLLLMPDSKYD